MEKVKKDLNDCNKEFVKQFSEIYKKLSNSMDKSYYYGQKDAYEEMLLWFKNSQNRSIKFIQPKTVKNYLIEKGAKLKNSLNDKKKDKEDYSKKLSKANFNYLFYNQTFNNENNYKNSNNYNVFPTSVEKAIYNNSNKSLNPFNFILNNNIKNDEDKQNFSLFSNPKAHNSQNHINNFSDVSINNNNSDNSSDEQMKPQIPIKNNIFFDFNLKTKKFNDK